MPNVLSLALLVLGLVALAVVLVRTLRVVGSTRRAQRRAVADLADRAGLLKARLAGIRVGVSERRNRWRRRSYTDRSARGVG